MSQYTLSEGVCCILISAEKDIITVLKAYYILLSILKRLWSFICIKYFNSSFIQGSRKVSELVERFLFVEYVCQRQPKIS